jgi:hypothetical protein
MSHVTDIVLLTFLDDSGVAKLNEWLKNNRWPELKEISGYAGGNKAMQCEIWTAAINNFDIDDFVCASKSIDWEYPESVQLLIKGEHDDAFLIRAGFLA